MDRRTFLNTAARSAAGGLLFTAMNHNQVFAGKINKIGLQLYTVRDQMKQDFNGTLAKVAALGYKEVEFAGYYERTPKQIKTVLASNGLTSPSAHVPLDQLRSQLDKAIENSAAMGHKYVVCPYLVDSERKSMDQYKQLAELFNKAGEACKKAGLQFAYHNHDFEFINMDGQMPYDLLLASTDAKLVQMELDLYWITKAGYDPLTYFAKHPGRFPLVHVKDMDKTPKKFFAEVGRGTIDFKMIFAQSGKAGIKHYFVEQDQCPGSPFDSIKISADYLKQLTF